MGECACQDAKECFCSNIGNCYHKPDHKVNVWTCPHRDPAGTMHDVFKQAPVWEEITILKHKCTRVPCPHIWDCESGECGLKEHEFACNMQLTDSGLMQERVTPKGNNVCETCEGTDRYDPRGKRCTPDCMRDFTVMPNVQ